MTDGIASVDAEGGVAVVVPPWLCKRAAAALWLAIERNTPAGYRASGPLPALARALDQAARLTEVGQVCRLDDDGPSRPVGWLTVTEAAERLSWSRRSVQRACVDGRLPSAWRLDGRTWLIAESDLEGAA
jgi:excisionase family DNA binding protein